MGMGGAGTPALTTRGFREEDFEEVAGFFDMAVQMAAKAKAASGRGWVGGRVGNVDGWGRGLFGIRVRWDDGVGSALDEEATYIHVLGLNFGDVKY